MDAAIAAFTAFLIAAGPLAAGVQYVVEAVRRFLDPNGNVAVVVWQVAAVVAGVALCWGWGYNLFGALVDAVPAVSDSAALDGTVGQVLTGIAVGAMAGFWHDHLMTTRAKEDSLILSAGSSSEPVLTEEV